MSKIEITDSAQLKTSQYNDDNEIGETYEDKGYSKIPLDQINLNTEPISITNEFNHSLFDTNIKSYIKVFLGFVIFIIILFIISILSGHFHYEKKETNDDNDLNNIRQDAQILINPNQLTNNQTINENNIINIPPKDKIKSIHN